MQLSIISLLVFDMSYIYSLDSEQPCNTSDLHNGIVILHFPKYELPEFTCL